MLEKLPSDKINGTKNALFFYRELQLIAVLLLIWDCYMSWSTRFISVKLCVGFSIFDSVSISLKFILLFNKIRGLFDFKTSQFFSKTKIIQKPHTVLLLDLWFLRWNIKFWNSMISMWVAAPQKWHGNNFLNLENWLTFLCLK